jgi:hypothetical protein
VKGRSSRGGSFLVLLCILFVVLKLTGVIDWSWWWVFSPLWAPAALVVAGLLLGAVLGFSIYKALTRGRKRQGAQAGSGQPAVVVEAAGSEVPASSPQKPEAPGLPAPGPEAESPTKPGGPSG